jgi:PAS domain-containing protein
MDVTQALLHSLPEPHIVLARDLSCIAVNRPFLDLLHISSEFLLGKSIGSVWPSASRVCAASGEHTVELRSEDGRLVT